MPLTPETRAAIFFGLLAAMLMLERLFPHRRSAMQARLRWPANFGLAALYTGLLWLIPVAAAGAAYVAQARGWGLLNLLPLAFAPKVLLGWLALDCAIYWQHRAFHEIRALWPIHRVHHSDIEFDASTGVRFHPAEILLSVFYKCGVALALGAPPLAVLLLETTLNGFALFNHANLKLPDRLERALRTVFVTPDMHRIHHSVHRAEMDSNYANSLSLWDRLFGSYTSQPRDGHTTMRIGLDDFRDDREQKLAALLSQPVR